MSEAQEHPAGAPAGTAAGRAAVRGGPRHAAPRKSVFTRYRMPAGKAIALAALPTAAFTVMGVMPKLALAEDSPKNPFSGDKCVEQSDSPKADESASPDASKSQKQKRATPKPSASPSKKPLLPKPGTSSSPQSKESSASKSSDSGDDSGDASPSPSPSETKNPLDPLGVGDKLGDLLGTNDDSDDSGSGSGDAATPKPSPTTSSPKPTAEPATKAPESGDSAKRDSSAEPKSPLDALKPKASETPKLPGTDGGDAKDDGKKPFPCPTNDPKAVADADVEPGIPALSDTPYVLNATKLTLYNLDYKGVVKVRTASGKIKPVLKYETTAIDIKNMKQSFEGGDGATGHVDGGPGTTSKFRNGKVTLYTEEMKGNLFGLIPVTFSPTSQPPPIPLPIAMLTDVKVTLAAQFGGTLTVPGLHLYNTE